MTYPRRQPSSGASLRSLLEPTSAVSGSSSLSTLRFARSCALVGALSFGFLTPGAWAQSSPARLSPEFRIASRPLITEPVDRGRLLPLRGAVHPAALSAQDVGAVEGSLPIEHIQLALRRTPERQTAFDALVEALQNPGNPSFHQWLTPEQVGAEFGASASDLATLTSYLQSEGFTVNGVSRSQMWVDFTGSAATVQRSFHTGLHRFRRASGEVYTSAAATAEFPAALMPAISGLVSLSNFPFHVQRRVVPEYAVGSTQSVGAQDFYTIYNELPLFSEGTPISGSGQTIALIEETDINPADVTAFRNIFGVTPAAPS